MGGDLTPPRNLFHDVGPEVLEDLSHAVVLLIMEVELATLELGSHQW